MDSIKRGFIFISEALRLARTNPSLIKRSSRGLGAGLLITLLLCLLASVALLVLKLSLVGGLIAGLLGAIWLISLPVLSYIFASSTIPGIANDLDQTSPDPGISSQVLRRWPDLLGLAIAVVPSSLFHKWGKGIFQAPWNAAPGLVRPALLIENLELKDALARTSGMIQSNLLLMDPGQVSVTIDCLVINGLSWLVGGVLAFVAGNGMVSSLQGNLGLVLGLGCGSLIFALFALASLAVTDFASAAYQTCLFLWARQVEQAGDASVSTNPPAPLSRALDGAASLSAPIFSE